MVSRAIVILNGHKPSRAATAAAHVLDGLGTKTRLEVTWNAAEGRAAAEHALSRGTDLVVAAGGDGTVMSVLGPVIEHQAALAVLPLGTANDFAVSLGIDGVSAALANLEDGLDVRLDAGRCELVGHDGAPVRGWFSSSAGVGMMARLAELEETPLFTLLKRTIRGGVWPVIATTATLTTQLAEARIRCDDATITTNIAALEITKLPKVGGIELTPDASAASGMLHAWVAEGEGRGALLSTLSHALRGRGKLVAAPHVQYVSREPATNRLGKSHVREIEVEAEPTLPVHLNGEHLGTTPARFRVLPGALVTRVPHAYAAQHGLSRVERRPRPRPALRVYSAASSAAWDE